MANDKSKESVKDSSWLQVQLVTLLQDAMEANPKDHAACAKYADLLWKMLPKNTGKDVRAKSLSELAGQVADDE